MGSDSTVIPLCLIIRYRDWRSQGWVNLCYDCADILGFSDMTGQPVSEPCATCGRGSDVPTGGK